ncbi:hypothetical protein L3X38_032851 [Prunus dulcis]|uniref:Uncharacterized protein n=1 Tax=Prunus dulcis TaxID=3755 RepID=A0AAD4VG96_PRUDU|nr:hypothetical protein L3X38_032851 [Prunus dulcis]
MRIDIDASKPLPLGLRALSISKRSTFLFKPKLNSGDIGVFVKNHWRHMLEQENGGLCGFSDDERNRQNYVPIIVNEPAIKTTVPYHPSQATGSMFLAPNPLQALDSMLPAPPTMSQAYASSQSAAVVSGTDNATNPMNGVIKSRVITLLENQGEPNFQAHIDPSLLVNKPCIEVVADMEQFGPPEDDQVYQEIVRKGKKKLIGEGRPTSSVKKAKLNLSPSPGVSLRTQTEDGSGISVWHHKLMTYKMKLIQWRRDMGDNNKQKIQARLGELERFHMSLASDNTLQQQEAVKAYLEKLWKVEELYWCQRLRINWLSAGDKNTRFFHLSTIQRR